MICAVCFAADGASSDNTTLLAHVAALPKLEGFTVVVESPFVILGNEAAEMVQRRATGSVRRTMSFLKKDFFARSPTEPTDIWLFRDRQSYTNYAWRLFKDRPESPFGYFREEKRAIVMNIATGEGTLVHEMVHAFIHENFPDCPPWFNEGFASLFEASGIKNGHIIGMINWRYRNLEQAIRAHELISFKELTAKTGEEFYSGKTYHYFYAQARFLCFYLQEKGLLQKYYRQFQKNAARDPTGYETLCSVLGRPDMMKFQAEWERFILDLHPR